jgi:hypothetical protein
VKKPKILFFGLLLLAGSALALYAHDTTIRVDLFRFSQAGGDDQGGGVTVKHTYTFNSGARASGNGKSAVIGLFGTYSPTSTVPTPHTPKPKKKYLELDTPRKLKVNKPYTVEVRLDNGEGNGPPIFNAYVEVYYKRSEVVSGYTDGKGEFTFTVELPGKYVVQASKDGYIGDQRNVVAELEVNETTTTIAYTPTTSSMSTTTQTTLVTTTVESTTTTTRYKPELTKSETTTTTTATTTTLKYGPETKPGVLSGLMTTCLSILPLLLILLILALLYLIWRMLRRRGKGQTGKDDLGDYGSPNKMSLGEMRQAGRVNLKKVRGRNNVTAWRQRDRPTITRNDIVNILYQFRQKIGEEKQSLKVWIKFFYCKLINWYRMMGKTRLEKV